MSLSKLHVAAGNGDLATLKLFLTNDDVNQLGTVRQSLVTLSPPVAPLSTRPSHFIAALCINPRIEPPPASVCGGVSRTSKDRIR
jgi:hypothetical protein